MRLREEWKDDRKKGKAVAKILGHDSAAAGRSRLGKFKVTDYEEVRKYSVYHLQRNLQTHKTHFAVAIFPKMSVTLALVFFFNVADCFSSQSC
jgi:hypothetical protein